MSQMSVVSQTPEPTTPRDGSLLEILLTTPSSSLHYTLRQILTHLQPETQLNLLLEVIDAASDASQIINEAVIAVWVYLVDTKVWSHRYQTLADLRVAIHWQDSVKPIMEKAQVLSSREAGAYATIYEHWGTTPTESFPSDIRPPNVSQMLARELARFSRICPKEEAITLIRKHINLRINELGRRNITTVMTNDIRQAYEEFNPPYREESSSLNNPPPIVPQPVRTVTPPVENPPHHPPHHSTVMVVIPHHPPRPPPRQIMSMVLVNQRPDFPREQYVDDTQMHDIHPDGNS